MKLIKEVLEKELFVNHKTVKLIAEEYGYTEKTVYGLMSRFNIKRPFKYYININKLYNPMDPVTNYLAGLIATDGYLHPKHDRIDIHLIGLSEKHLLESIINYYESNIPVGSYKYKFNPEGRYGIGLTAKGIREFFTDNFNIPIREKTSCVSTPSNFYSEDCARAYIRGCFDGDGYISPNIPRLCILTQSENFISGLRDIIGKYTSIKPSIAYVRGYPALYYQHSSVKEVCDWMYTKSEIIRLERKYLKYLELINASNSSTKAPGLI